jgi:transposase
VKKSTKISIQNELYSIRQQYESKKSSLQSEALTIIELLFGLFNIILLTMGMKTTSQNSHLPPSRDPYRKKKAKNSKKKQMGGVPGHRGKSLEQVEHADKVITHVVSTCHSCRASLNDLSCTHISKHQVFDIEFNVIVTEHQVEHKTCLCGHHQSGALPQHVSSSPCSYGPSVKALAMDLTQVQFVPLKRASEFFFNKFGLSVSETSLMNFSREFYDKLKQEWEPKTEKALKDSEVLNGDETGININGENAWIHSLSNDLVVLMKPHYDRGAAAMDEIGILPHYNSILCHDFWASYGSYDVIHACCHAHLKRELRRAYEDFDQKWAKRMSNILQDANELRNKQEGILSWKQIQSVENKYTRILHAAEVECPLVRDRKNKRGRIRQTYPRQLLNRLIGKRSWVLMFLYDPRVPYTNNRAERDIRMAKVQQKVSGCFRTFEGAERFCLARSFVLSMNRQGRNAPEAIEALFRGT